MRGLKCSLKIRKILKRATSNPARFRYKLKISPSVSAEGFDLFLDALEVHENLLHAETQAIAAKHLNTIEEILDKKDISLSALLESKENLGVDPRSYKQANRLIDRVLELQQRNADSFRKFFKERSAKEKGSELKISSQEQKIRNAYLRSARKNNED